MGHTSFQLNRRAFLRAGLSTAGALALGPAFFERAFAAGPVTVGEGPYGPLQPFDPNGIALPAGFSSRKIAQGGSLVDGSVPPYVWHGATDGQATFPTLTDGRPDGGWILVANSEMPVPGTGGVSGVEFAADGSVERAHRVLAGTTSNCAGGPTPWGTWLSCEEHFRGMVHECDPATLAPLTPLTTSRPALGVFAHEAVCVDPGDGRLYLTEDVGDGCLYRFTPSNGPGDLSAGTLEVATGQADGGGRAAPGKLEWEEVPDPSAGIPLLNPDPPEMSDPTRHQVDGAVHFDGGEGIWFDDGTVYFTTKGDGRVWTYDVASSALDILYDEAAVGPDAPLSGVDNITVSPSGDIYVCEDGRDHDICLITPDFEITRFLKLDPVMHAGPPDPSPVADNETVGVVFSPDGTRMYFGAQRSCLGGNDQVPTGAVYEISGPFRHPAPTGRGGGPNGSGGSGGANGSSRGRASQDGVAPGMRLRAKRRTSIEKCLRHGLSISLELDEPAGIDATLKIAAPRAAAAGKRRRSKLLAGTKTSVAVRGRVNLSLRPRKKLMRRLRSEQELVAQLRVVATDAAGNRTVRRRKVTLVG